MTYKIVLKRGEKREFVKEEMARTDCKTRDIRVIPTYLGICGSDLFHYMNDSEDNICFGHEWIGKVSEVGTNVSHVKVGDVVTTSSTLGCGECSECKQSRVNFCLKPIHLGSPQMGALTNEMVFNVFNARVLRSHSKAEVLIEVVAVAEEAVRLMKEECSLLGKRILVMGAGTVGLLIAYLLKKENCDVMLIDPHQKRMERAKRLNIPSMSLKAFSVMGERNSYDVIFDATSDRGEEIGGFHLLSKFAALHSHILIVGKYLREVNVNMNGLAKLGGTIKFMRGVPLSTMDLTIEKWSSHLDELADVLISHEFNASEIQKGFETALMNSESGKVVIQINGMI
jgi:threonine dehydrogenase-like Zn-dependent dehydrogenase